MEWRDVTAPSLKWNQQLVVNMTNRPSGGPHPVGLNLLMGSTTATKVNNMMHNMEEERIKVIQGVLVLGD